MDQELFEKAISEYFTKVIDEENPQLYKFVKTDRHYKKKNYFKTEEGFFRASMARIKTLTE